MLSNGGDLTRTDDYRHILAYLFEQKQAMSEQTLAVFEVNVFIQKSCQKVKYDQRLLLALSATGLNHSQHLVASESTRKADLIHHADRIVGVGAN